MLPAILFGGLKLRETGTAIATLVANLLIGVISVMIQSMDPWVVLLGVKTILY